MIEKLIIENWKIFELKAMAKVYGWTKLEQETGLTRATLYNTLNNKSEPKLNDF